MTPLLYAARDGRLESATCLGRAGADIEQADANGITPLLMAITNNHVDVARLLIDQRRGRQSRRLVRPHAAVGGSRDCATWTSTARRSKTASTAAPVLDLIKVLLEKGADVNARTKEVAADPAADAASHGRLCRGSTSPDRRRF